MDISATLDYLYSLQTKGIKLGLGRVREFLRLLNDPHACFKSIHIAGTNGKGSIARLVYEALQARGYSAGLYTSPHLARFNERIVVNNEEITDERICVFTDKYRHCFKDLHLTFFEATTAMAFDHFRNEKIDVAVIETGMGGRLDATNTIMPLVSVIGDISMDHEQYLGGTIEKIAGEKAGIIKKGVPVVIGIGNEAANMAVLEKAPHAIVALKDYSAEIIDETVIGATVNIVGPSLKLENILVPLPGRHQIKNALVAVAALMVAEPGISPATIKRGFASARMPGRLELRKGTPDILFDVAHNPAKTAALNDHVSRFFSNRDIVIVFGVMADKDYKSMLDTLRAANRRFIFTRPGTERACDPVLLQKCVPDAEIVPDVTIAVARARELAGLQGLVVVTGSFYTVGEAMALPSSPSIS